MNFFEFMFFLAIGALFGSILGSVVGKIAATIQNKRDLHQIEDSSNRNSMEDFIVEIEFIPEHQTYYAYKADTGKFLTQDQDPKALGKKIAEILPKNTNLVFKSIKSVGKFRE
ncbi:MAG: hypothetical protein N2235_05205 [Fischerella sp.]|nr:hypothetical protein [Fischerella sp.]